MSWFLPVTFVMTWALWLAPGALGVADSSVFGVGGPVFLLGVFAPGIVAIALTAMSEGRDGVTRLLAPVGRWQVAVRWYLFAVGYLAAIKLTAAAILRVTTGAWPAFGETPWPLIFGAILISTWVQAGEEVGWRGYGLPRLSRHVGIGGASLLLGIIWAAWHLPLFFMPGTGSTGQSFPVYLLHVMPLSVAIGWLYWKTNGSLLLVMLMHASVNNTTGIVPAAVPGASDPLTFSGSRVAWLTLALSWVIAVPLLWQMRGAAVDTMTRPEPVRGTM